MALGSACPSVRCAILFGMTPICLHAPVQRLERYPGDNFLIAVEAPKIAAACKPGQFVMAALEEPLSHPAPLLKRALAVYSVEEHEGLPHRITLLIKRVGDGTTRLLNARPGDRLSLVGPLGNGFELDSEPGGSHLVVAGGIGIASVFLAVQALSRAGEDVRLIYGARTSRDLVGLDDFRRLDIPITATTEDGSQGLHGLVTEGLREVLAEVGANRCALYVCGPNPMMEAVAAIASQRNIPCQISVEVKMACGFGVCLGCSVKTVQGYRLACTHGPVFEADTFIWEPAPQESVRAS